jgi:bilirubin oxidase
MALRVPHADTRNSSTNDVCQGDDVQVYAHRLTLLLSLRSTQINDTKVEFYNATIDKFTQQVYPNLGPANLVGYNSSTPGPTFRIQKGTQSIHRWTNNGDTGAAIHTHGSHARSAWDGWASDTVMPGQYKDYYYPNSQGARTLWYHVCYS